MKKTQTCSADAFKSDDYTYCFPFTVLDDAPGGRNLGRIEWGIELLHGRKRKGRYCIEKLLVFARQTRDKRYVGKVFEIPCFAEMLQGAMLTRRGGFIEHVWNIGICPEHKGPVLAAYPDNQHSQLVIDVMSSIMIDANFK